MKQNQRLKRNKIILTLLIGYTLSLFSVSGCGGGSQPTHLPQKDRTPQSEKKGDKRKVGPATVLETKESEKKEEYAYNPSGKADPFKPFFQLEKEYSKIPLTPLQKYEISQLKLVAIISSPEGNIALIEDGTGKGYFLKKGTLVGKNDGKVTKIFKDKVIIEELQQDIFGQKKTSQISLFLHPLEEREER